MPILKAEPDCFPEDLLEQPVGEFTWWACYTRSRHEKNLMRTLRDANIAHYSPVISRRYRSPAGRIRESFLPLFSNYVFIRGDEMSRYEAVCSGVVSRVIPVEEPERLIHDLEQIQRLIQTGAPLAPEARLEPGDLVRVRNGRFAGFEGRVLRRLGQTVLVVEVRFMNQGASVALDDCQFELLSKAVLASA